MWFMHLVSSRYRKQDEAAAPQTRGLILTWARRYDLLVWFLSLYRPGVVPRSGGEWKAYHTSNQEFARVREVLTRTARTAASH